MCVQCVTRNTFSYVVMLMRYEKEKKCRPGLLVFKANDTYCRIRYIACFSPVFWFRVLFLVASACFLERFFVIGVLKTKNTHRT